MDTQNLLICLDVELQEDALVGISCSITNNDNQLIAGTSSKRRRNSRIQRIQSKQQYHTGDTRGLKPKRIQKCSKCKKQWWS